jgi:hypothetical protein
VSNIFCVSVCLFDLLLWRSFTKLFRYVHFNFILTTQIVETIAWTTTTLCSLRVRCLNIKVSYVITIYNGRNLNANINKHLNYWRHYWLCNNSANDIAVIVLHLYMKSSHKNCKVYSIQHMWSSLSVTYDRSVIFAGYSGLLH